MKELRKKNGLVLLGVTQEQHPDRCRLFAQWQQFDWPILHDPINLLKLRAVPIVIAIDEHGIVRDTRPRPSSIESFVKKTFEAPAAKSEAAAAKRPKLGDLKTRATQDKSLRSWTALGDAAILWGTPKDLEKAIAAYRSATEITPEDASIHFRLGVAYRMRYESRFRNENDFRTAVEEWGRALELDPNQYIYRRRIQQYGPRLIKPYPFYDWVDRAIREIKARNETPLPLAVMPSGAEIASPSKQLLSSDDTAKSPDPKGRINRDSQRLIRISSVVVPSEIKRGGAGRIHLSLRPTRQAHWNNEAEPLTIWIERTDGWTIEKRLLKSVQPKQSESREERTLEFEVRAPRGAGKTSKLKGYALYYVCEDRGGKCLYLRQEIVIDVNLRE